MSYPYPQDRHLDRKEKGDQPYKDAREAMAQSEAELQSEAEAFGEAKSDDGNARRQRREDEAEREIAEINEELRQARTAGDA